ncbi:Holliday junction branch migration protein RuvA [Roseivirga sp. BDSF3-8]|uniref:Holliday junction branch migration protein RuvA n=1 Tax=Roseivirga sp. BDSF3-8 TaxID=3241598 RepID=UPI003531AD4A
MIAYVEGKLVHKEFAHVVIDTGGLGYEVKISLNTYNSLPPGESCKLFTHLHIKEDAHTLFGFTAPDEKKLFLDLLGISGVGPNTALTVLSAMSPDEVRKAIVNEEVKTIQRVKGIGAKTAQRIILELKDKLRKDGVEATGGDNIGRVSNNLVREEALTALITLGFAKPAAEKTIDGILKKASGTPTVEELIKLALKSA